MDNPLLKFSYGRKTDISKGVINNRDALLLLLVAHDGMIQVKLAKKLLREWRPIVRPDGAISTNQLHFTYLFNLYYGHTTGKYDSQRRCHYSAGPVTFRPWRGVVTLSLFGKQRLAQLTG